MPIFRSKPTTIAAEHFDWKDGQGIPDIAGVKYREWVLVDVGSGLKKNAPVLATAYVETMHGPVNVKRGDWIAREPGGDGYYPIDAKVFAAKYEPAD